MALLVHGVAAFGKRTKGYRIWVAARNRCRNPNNYDYRYYGGRGITFCTRWDDFQTFIKDMGGEPGPLDTLDRIKGHLGYEPENCRWATRKTQAQNRIYCRVTDEDFPRIRELHQHGKTQAEIGKLYGVSQVRISQILRT